jgi:anti-sigma factor RsiW
MSAQHSGQAPHLSCAECQDRLQDYIDDALSRPDSMQVYLHVRDCEPCAEALGALEALVERLEGLPARPAPDDFDARVLAAVPYDSYRAMANLRAPRVPVLLDPETLPAWVRHGATRTVGGVVGAGSLAAWLTVMPEPALLVVAGIGLVPELVVRLQMAGRLVVQATRRAGEGA